MIIRSVRCYTSLSENGVVPVKQDEQGRNIGYAKKGNNHHVAIYQDKSGQYQEAMKTIETGLQNEVIKNDQKSFILLFKLQMDMLEQDKKYQEALEKCDDVLKELRASQGKEIEIIGLLIPKDKDSFETNMLKDGRIEVTEWSVLK